MADSTPAPATTAPAPNANRSTTPVSSAFKDYISRHWAERTEAVPAPREVARYAAARRLRISELHPGERLIIPAGPAKVRSNDTDYAYRPHSAFTHLTGWGAEAVPDSVLVLEPTATGHEATLYFRPSAGRDSDEFYANAAIGEFWLGPRPSLAHVAADLALATKPLSEFDEMLLTSDAASRGLDDEELLRDLSELRLVKDEWEIAQMRLAIAATKQGFDDVIADRPAITAHPRGERLVEGTFNRRARAEGNQVGYDTIAASGAHACILHWTTNDGAVVPGDLILIDAGVELDSLYTADITRRCRSLAPSPRCSGGSTRRCGRRRMRPSRSYGRASGSARSTPRP